MTEAGSIELISSVGDAAFPDEWYHISRADHFWFQWRFVAALRQAGSIGMPLTKPLKVLEIGCGSGVLREQFEGATRWTIDATDLYLPALKVAKAGRGRTLYYDVLEERPGFVGEYDAVILFDVLEHIADTQGFLRSVIRHLVPGGHLLINVPASMALHSAYDVAAGHLRRYSRPSLKAEFEQLEFDVLDVRYWGLSLVPLLLARRVWLRKADAETIRAGFEPPGPRLHAWLRALMRAETRSLTRPFAGSSVLLAGRRRDNPAEAGPRPPA